MADDVDMIADRESRVTSTEGDILPIECWRRPEPDRELRVALPYVHAWTALGWFEIRNDGVVAKLVWRGEGEPVRPRGK